MTEETEPKELKWLREYSNGRKELKENALKNGSLPDFAGFDLEFWKKIYEEGKHTGATENGMQWHDTRHATCIEDFPQDKDKLYAFKVNKAKYEKDTPIIEYMIGSSDDCYYEAMMHKVIAWCEIPQFKE